MRINYKIVSLIPMFGFMYGCSMHRGVITYIDNRNIVVKDIDVNKETTFIRDTTKAVHPNAKYVHMGDTVYVQSAQYYKDTLYISKNNRLMVNCAMIEKRKEQDR